MLAGGQRTWIETLKRAVRQAIEEDQLAPETDPEQIAFEMFGIALVVHHHRRLLGYPKARARALTALESLLERHAAPAKTLRAVSSAAKESMSLSAALPQISANVRFAASRLLFPELAGALAERLFLTPPRPRDAAATALDLIDARSGVVEHKGRSIVTWRWGSREAPAVLLAHGWGGNAAQMRGFVFPLLSAGYRVIAFDQPAHGVSEGKLTGLPDFADVLAEVAWHHGGVAGVIAHSMGGAATAIALARGLRVARVVTVGASARRVVLFAAVREVVLDAAARAGGDAGRGRGALRRALVGARDAQARPASQHAGADDPRPQRPPDPVAPGRGVARRRPAAKLITTQAGPCTHPPRRRGDQHCHHFRMRSLTVSWHDPRELAQAGHAMPRAASSSCAPSATVGCPRHDGRVAGFRLVEVDTGHASSIQPGEQHQTRSAWSTRNRDDAP